MLFKSIGNVFKKNKTQDDMLVFSGIHIVTELIGGLPKLGLKTQIGAVATIHFRWLFFGRSGLSFEFLSGHRVPLT
jgi:hypothetical protein